MIYFFEVLDDLDEKQRREVSAELNDTTKLNNVLRSMNTTSGNNTNNRNQIRTIEANLEKQKQEMEELQPYLKPELQFELDEDIKFKVYKSDIISSMMG